MRRRSSKLEQLRLFYVLEKKKKDAVVLKRLIRLKEQVQVDTSNKISAICDRELTEFVVENFFLFFCLPS